MLRQNSQSAYEILNITQPKKNQNNLPTPIPLQLKCPNKLIRRSPFPLLIPGCCCFTFSVQLDILELYKTGIISKMHDAIKPFLISFHCKIRNTLHSHFPDNTYVLGEADGLLMAYHHCKVLLAWLYPK